MCPRSGLIPQAVLTFDPEGILVAIDTDVSQMDSMHGIEFFSGILVPGLINAHCHLELSYLQGKIEPGSGLAGFIRQIMAVREETPVEERIYAADVQNSLMWQEGVAAVADICNSSFTFPLKRKSPVRYHSFIEIFGIDPSVSDQAYAHGKTVAERAERDKLAFSLTPHSTYSLSEPLFGHIVQENTPPNPMSIHFMESVAEQELFQDKGLFAEGYRNDGLRVDFTRFGSPAGRLVEMLDPETPLLLVHNACVGEDDIDRIHARFKSATWVVCPRSNDYIEGGFPPIELLRRKGCRIAVGTDGLSSNTSLSMLDEIKFLSKKAPQIPLTELIKWSSLHGAEGLGMDSFMGSFELGKKSGAVLLDHIDWNRMALTKLSTARRIV